MRSNKNVDRARHFEAMVDVVRSLSDTNGHIRFHKNGKRVSKHFSEVWREIVEVRGRLATLQADDRDMRVAILGPTSYEWMIVDLACLLSGIVLLALPEGASPSEIADVVAEMKPKLFLIDDRMKSVTVDGPTVYKINCRECDRQSFFSVEISDAPPVQMTSSEWYTVCFTSGTQGRIKRLYIDYAAPSDPPGRGKRIATSGDGGSGTTLIWMPLSHYVQRWNVLYSFYRGYGVFISSTSRCLEDFLAESVTFTIAAPVFYERLSCVLQIRMRAKKLPHRLLHVLYYIAGINRLVESSIIRSFFEQILFADFLVARKGPTEFYWSGAGIHRTSLILLERFGIRVYGGYGVSEIGPISSDSRDTFRLGSVGIPSRDLKISEDGQILVRSDDQVRDYRQLAVNRDNYIETGDLGRLDRDGYLYVLGRQDDIIVLSNGKNIIPTEIEDILKTSTAVLDACVFTRHGDKLSAILAVEISPTMESDALEAVTRANRDLRLYQRVSEFAVVPPFSEGDGLRTRSGKTRRAHVLQKYADMEGFYKVRVEPQVFD